MAHDIIAVLKGKFPLASRGNGPTIDICDLSQPGHYKIGYVLIQNTTSTRSPVFEQPWQQFLRVVRFEASRLVWGVRGPGCWSGALGVYAMTWRTVDDIGTIRQKNIQNMKRIVVHIWCNLSVML